MAYLKLKVVEFLLKYNVKIGRRLTFYHAKFSVTEKEIDDFIEKPKFDLSKLPENIKKVLLHDQDIIDKRWDECQNCEHLVKTTSQCKKCGCFMKLKHRIATVGCPIGKWDKEYEFKDLVKGNITNGSPVTAELQ